jgi:membrane protease YdiL (CAAX protease family)
MTGSPMSSALLKVAAPLAVMGVIGIVVTRRHRSWRTFVGIARPGAGSLALWLAIYLVWMLATNAVMRWRGPWDFTPWRQAPLAVSVLRVLAVGVLGPIAEELIFRGVLYSRLSATALGEWPTIVVLSGVWTSMHYTEPLPVLALFFVDGILLGAARRNSGTVVVPIAMHMVWNLYAIW